MIDNNQSEQRKISGKSLANLKPYQPGQPGNPGGRPKDPGITAGQIEKLDEKCPFGSKGRAWREYLIEKGLLQAGESPKAMEHLKERLEGKVPDKHEIETGDISIVYKQVDGGKE